MIDVTGLDEIIANTASLQNGLTNIETGLQQAVDNVVVPQLEEYSAEVWQVRTGNYSNGWYSEIAGPGTVMVANAVDYATPLETGWTTKAGTEVPSTGVLLPTMLASVDAVAEELVSWLMAQAGL